MIGRSVVVTLAVVLTACAARTPPRPTGSQTPDPTAADAFTRATKSCIGLKTVTGELRLSGRAGDEGIRGTLLTGLAAPASIRFEAVAPFGAPVFILAGRDNRATLLFPRDNRVLPDAAVSEILGRITGLSLSATDLRLILTGCLVENPQPSDGRAWPGGWKAITLVPSPSTSLTAGPSTPPSAINAYLKNVNGAPALVAADYGEWLIDYTNHQNGFPRNVRIRSGTVNISAAIEQLEINTAIDDRAFAVDIPPNAERLSLENLRSVAPLRGSN